MLTWLLYALLTGTLVAIGVLFVGIARYDAVPMPSPGPVRRAILDEVARHPRLLRVVDLGAGWGGLSRQLARSCPEREVEGVEANLVPYLFATMRNRLPGGPTNLRYTRRDIRDLEPQPNTLYVCYLSPEGMRAVRDLLEAHGCPRNVVVSALFGVRGWEPVHTTTADDIHRTAVFVYER